MRWKRKENLEEEEGPQSEKDPGPRKKRESGEKSRCPREGPCAGGTGSGADRRKTPEATG